MTSFGPGFVLAMGAVGIGLVAVMFKGSSIKDSVTKYEDPDPRKMDRNYQARMIAKKAMESDKPIYRMTKKERLDPNSW